jgi:hypothetical protein
VGRASRLDELVDHALVHWGGDFNVTRFPSERSGVACRLAMSDFFAFLHEQGLLDLPLARGLFTWSLAQVPPKWSRIDHFLISPDWEARFPGVAQKRLPRICSDHFPLLLDNVNGPRGKRLFKFENMWLKKEGFGALVKQCSSKAMVRFLSFPRFV